MIHTAFQLALIGTPFIPSASQLRPFSAPLWLIGTMVAVLLTPFFTRRSNIICGLVSLSGLAMALLSLLIGGTGPGMMGEFYRGFLIFDRVAFLWQAILLLFTVGVIVMWFATTRTTMHEGDGAEFFTLLIGATLGMCLMASTANLLMLFLAVEMASLPSYVLAGFRKTHHLGAEASLKYVLFGAAASSIMVYGLSLLYGLYGTLQLSELAAGVVHQNGSTALLVVALAGIIVGIGFKISAVPFHFWCPDVFEGASIEVTAFLSVASKGAAIILLLRVLMSFADAGAFASGSTLSVLAIVIGLIGAITATVGNTGAFIQENLKRLLAYSSIAHAGYMLCALSLLIRSSSAGAGFDPAAAATQAILLYLFAYAFMNLGAFAVTATVARATGGETLAQFKGLGRRSPLLAACMFCCMISLIGLPPFAGFVAKLNLLWVLFQNGSWWWILIVVIGINTILSAFYYFRVLRAMYLETSDDPRDLSPDLVGVTLCVVCAAALLMLFLGFGPLNRIATDYGHLYRAPAQMVASTR